MSWKCVHAYIHFYSLPTNPTLPYLYTIYTYTLPLKQTIPSAAQRPRPTTYIHPSIQLHARSLCTTYPHIHPPAARRLRVCIGSLVHTYIYNYLHTYTGHMPTRVHRCKTPTPPSTQQQHKCIHASTHAYLHMHVHKKDPRRASCTCTHARTGVTGLALESGCVTEADMYTMAAAAPGGGPAALGGRDKRRLALPSFAETPWEVDTDSLPKK